VVVLAVGCCMWFVLFFFFSSRRRHTRSKRDWSSDVCSSDFMAPAWAVTAFDGLVITNGEPLRAGAPLIAAIILALIVATLLWGARLFALSRLHHDEAEDDDE